MIDDLTIAIVIILARPFWLGYTLKLLLEGKISAFRELARISGATGEGSRAVVLLLHSPIAAAEIQG